MVSCIFEASSFTDFQSSLQWPLTYESRENTHSRRPSPFYTHTHTESKQAQPNNSVRHTVTTCSSSSPDTQNDIANITFHLEFSCLSWRRQPGTGGEAVDHLNQSSVVRNYFFYEIFGQWRFGEFRAFSITSTSCRPYSFSRRRFL